MYSKVEVYGGCDINYIDIYSNTHSDSQIEEIVKKGLYVPTWGDSNILSATFQNSVNATPLSVSEDAKVCGYQIQRLDVKNNTMYPITQDSNTKIQDFNVCSGKEYKYYIFPIIENIESGTKTFGSPLISESIFPIWNMCTIIGLKETGKKNEYIVDTENIWKLYLNVEQENYELNMDKQYTDGFDRFPKRTQGIKKYVTSGINSILGVIDCATQKITNSIHDIEKWEEFCYSPNLKLFNDMHGRIIPVDIKSSSISYLANMHTDSPLVASITFTQLADAEDISVYSTINEFGGD